MITDSDLFQNMESTIPGRALEIIKEGLDKHAANALLGEGWLFIACKVTRSVDSAGEFEDEVTYNLGKPAKP